MSGFLGTGLAALHGDCVKGLILLNATPFWAFMPNRKHLPAWAQPLIPWDGALPAPEPMYKIGAAYFDALRNPTTITTMLDGQCTTPSHHWCPDKSQCLTSLCLVCVGAQPCTPTRVRTMRG